MYYPTLEDFRKTAKLGKHHTGIPLDFGGYGDPGVCFLQVDA